MIHRTRTVHQHAYCSECGKIWEDYRNHRARKQARYHAEKTGHRVCVETGTVTTYNH